MGWTAQTANSRRISDILWGVIAILQSSAQLSIINNWKAIFLFLFYQDVNVHNKYEIINDVDQWNNIYTLVRQKVNYTCAKSKCIKHNSNCLKEELHKPNIILLTQSQKLLQSFIVSWHEFYIPYCKNPIWITVMNVSYWIQSELWIVSY